MFSGSSVKLNLMSFIYDDFAKKMNPVSIICDVVQVTHEQIQINENERKTVSCDKLFLSFCM